MSSLHCKPHFESHYRYEVNQHGVVLEVYEPGREKDLISRPDRNPLTASPLVFTPSLPKQKHSRAKSRQPRRLKANVTVAYQNLRERSLRVRPSNQA